MAPPMPYHDALAGAGIAAWVVGMGLTLGADDAVWQVVGGVLWGGGFLVASAAAVHAYITRVRSGDDVTK
ncbi:hypothetical protein [Microbacterium sp. 10M-3C3]|jgi:hypothetical protein|uniref:hypothetical protein n=1 Tax=Microbacterium sp. 10M-3C3 TaxID=2483401 RepID=UPI000F630051|nr:hypothetical protein [Microbacterium sp. 10M-3C3]